MKKQKNKKTCIWHPDDVTKKRKKENNTPSFHNCSEREREWYKALISSENLYDKERIKVAHTIRAISEMSIICPE